MWTPSETERPPGYLRAARWVLGVAVFGSAMAIGSLHTVVLGVVTAVLGVAAWLAWWGAQPLRARPVASVLFWLAVGLTAYTLLQATPMPAAWLATIAPGSADVWARCLSPLREQGPAWATLSLDPIATRIEVLRGAAYVLAFITAVRIASRREGVTFLEGVLIATGLALAVAAWVHPALGADKVYGFYQPVRDPGARHIAPILNANALSGYLNIALCIIFAQALAPRALLPRPIALALLAFMMATQLWVASRGGTLGMACGMVAVLWLSWSSRQEGGRPRAAALLAAFMVVVGVGMGVLASSETAWQELATTETSKLDVIRQAFRLVPLFPIFGVGRGAFEAAFPAVRTGYAYMTFNHPENIVAQWTTEWGIVVAAAAAVLMVAALRPTTALKRSNTATGAWAALVCVGLQNLVDFSSEFPGVVIALVVCGAIVTGGTSGVEAAQGGGWARRPNLLTVAVLGAAAGAVLLVIPGWSHELRSEENRLRELALDPGVSREAFHAEVRAAMLRHPAEPYLPFTGGLRAMRVHDESLLPWMERTLDRARIHGPAHLLLARAFRRVAPRQALLEYRTAFEQSHELAPAGVPEALPLVHGYDDARELAPNGEGDLEGYLNWFIGLLDARLPATAARLEEDLEAVNPKLSQGVWRRASQALADLRAGDAASWCSGEARKGCVTHALDESSQLQKDSPSRCDGFLMQAQVLVEAGEARRGAEELERAAEQVVDRQRCLRELADLATNAHVDDVVTKALDQLTRLGCEVQADCVDNLRIAARIERARGNPRRALAALQRAHEQAPEDDGLLAEVAQLASGVQMHGEAVQAYLELARRHPGDARWSTAIARERDAFLQRDAHP